MDRSCSKQGNPLISVVIPTFRRPDVLDELLAVLANQLPAVDAEVLIVDNCSHASALPVVRKRNCPKLRYFHEHRSGVVHARNRGLSEAKGDYILFLDDDEVPSPGWLSAFAGVARRGTKAAFGRIKARYSCDPSQDVKPLLDEMFTRKLTPAGGDITKDYVVLGCGNAMFHRDTCFGNSQLFETTYNRLGGEDSALIKRLVYKGIRLEWVAEGVVEEVVPADRQTAEYLKTRRYNQGRLRTQISINHNPFSGLKWMAVGAAQAVLYASLWCVARVKGSGRATYYSVQFQGGLGKLIWWHTPAQLRTYGA